MPFKGMKAFFFEKYFIKFCGFPKFNFLFHFLKKSSRLTWKRHLTNSIVWYAFYNKFATFTDFEKVQVFPKNLNFFLKKSIFERNENSYCFSRILRQICYSLAQKVSRSKLNFSAEETLDIKWQVRVIQTSGSGILTGWFSFDNISMGGK